MEATPAMDSEPPAETLAPFDLMPNLATSRQQRVHIELVAGVKTSAFHSVIILLWKFDPG